MEKKNGAATCTCAVAALVEEDWLLVGNHADSALRFETPPVNVLDILRQHADGDVIPRPIAHGRDAFDELTVCDRQLTVCDDVVGDGLAAIDDDRVAGPNHERCQMPP